jgi:hypothetical protein
MFLNEAIFKVANFKNVLLTSLLLAQNILKDFALNQSQS